MLVVLIAMLAAGASPDSTREAQRLAHQSTLEYDVGNFQAALEDVKRAYLLDPRPGLLYNLGQCHRALKHWDQAEFFYRNYLHRSPTAPNRVGVQQLIAEMQAKQIQPAPLIQLSSPPPEVVPPRLPPAPVAAVEAPVMPQRHSHALAYGLGAATLACVGVAIAGSVVVANYETLRGQIAGGKFTVAQYAEATQQSPGANTWQIVAIVAGITAAGGAVATGLTW
jgi:tetratricopeptide (TPR) repeat protein